jgi:hypothetical protein
MLRDHFAHVEQELGRVMSEWVTLPIAEVPLGPARLKWLQDRAEPLTSTVSHSWDAIFAEVPGSREAVPRARMRLLESLQDAATQRDAGLVRSAMARRKLGRSRPDDKRLVERLNADAVRRGIGAANADQTREELETWGRWQPPSTERVAQIARLWFAAQYPEYGGRLSGEDWLAALVAFERGRGQRSDGDDKGKWAVLTGFVVKAGCAKQRPANLKKDWMRWQKGASYRTLFPVLAQEQDELRHAERSSSPIGATSRGRSRKSKRGRR